MSATRRLRKRFAGRLSNNAQLVHERFPVGRHSSRRSRYGLILGMRMRRKQLHASDHRPLLVIVEPVLTRLKAGYDRMPRRRRMLRCMLTRRTVTATDVSTFRTSAEMEPPAFRRRQAFHTSLATWSRGEIDSAQIILHFDCSFRRYMSGSGFKAPARSSRYHLFPPALEPRPLH